MSIESARDNGFIHEQGLAQEFMGHYLSSIIELKEATKCYKNAYECYMQWGAVAKAKQIQKDYNLCFADGEFKGNSLKHSRDF
mmetsp:Transcript_14008/g.30499  ORF Transcript_14008/g.30499 Transcript_14008/m.30499 type:complete len:83 (+) Transcript_14008:347-595(+)